MVQDTDKAEVCYRWIRIQIKLKSLPQVEQGKDKGEVCYRWIRIQIKLKSLPQVNQDIDKTGLQ